MTHLALLEKTGVPAQFSGPAALAAAPEPAAAEAVPINGTVTQHQA